ncbi:MAG: hypothetical protein ACREO0_05880 [Pseudoxanthomonas sp.]
MATVRVDSTGVAGDADDPALADPDPGQARKAMPATVRMNKPDIGELRRAAGRPIAHRYWRRRRSRLVANGIGCLLSEGRR